MAIKIIRHGNKKRCMCASCSCIFTYEKEDVKTVGGYNEYKSYVLCPDCGEQCTADIFSVKNPREI